MKQRSLKQNFLMNAILTMSNFIFPLITFPYVSRILLPEGMGKVTFAASVISYFSMFAQLGIPVYGIRACAKVREDKKKLSQTAHELLIINIAMSAFCYASFGVLLFYVPKFREEKALFLITSLTILFNTIGMEWLYKALEQYTYITIRSIVFKFVALAAMFALIHSKTDYVIYGAISIFASSASNIMNFFNSRKFIFLKSCGKYDFKQHLPPVLVFFAMSCATTVYTHLDVVMLGFMSTDTDVGYYNAAIKIKVILVSIVTSLGHVLLPRLSYYIQNNMTEEFRNITDKAVNFIVVLAAPLTVYFMLFAREGIFFLSGREYVGSVLPMQILMPTLLLIGLSSLMGLQILVPLGREKTVLYSEVMGAGVDLLINSLTIPRFASVGAAAGTLTAEAVVWLFQFCALKSVVIPSYKKIRYPIILLGLASGSLSAFLIKRLIHNLFFMLMISATSFFGVYGTVLLAGKEPIAVEIKKIVLREQKK